jgi:ADP-ribosylglycohydrolase/fructose-1,6-bisphosphatase/inositol monophosphatase family enzyme
MDSYAQALSAAIEAARQAGAMFREEFYRPGGPRGSGGHAPADEEAGRRIREMLRPFPWSFRCEDPAIFERGTDPHHLWLVDPNDGTSSYLKGHRGSAVSIAALRDGVPVLGVVYAFAYPDSGEGDLIAWAEGCPLTRNGSPVTASLAGAALDDNANPPPVVFLSQDADNNPAANAECVRPARYIALPSIAYRLARVAVGDGVAAVSLNGPCGWDYAAGHALLRASGGVLVNERGQEVTYGADGGSSVRHCFGGAPAVVNELCRRPWQNVFAHSSPSTGLFRLVRPVPGRAVADAGVLSRAHGCLLGQLAGDSLGGLVEFQSQSAIRRTFPHGVRDLRDGGHWGNMAGQPTDDSEMALMLARTLVQEGRYDRGKVLDAYVHWWLRAWDRGGTITKALGPASRGQTTAESLQLAEQHADPSRPSNGCLMRISPLGIFGAGRTAEAAAWAREDSRLTHPNSVCQGACAVYVAAIASAIADGGTAQACHAAALAEADRAGVEPSVRTALVDAQHAPPADYSRNMGWVLIALQNAFWQLLHAANLEEGVVDTVMRGGDTDTTVAIAGALLGAVHGRAAIPPRWLHALLSCRPLAKPASQHPQPAEFWPVDALQLAEALLTAGAQAR